MCAYHTKRYSSAYVQKKKKKLKNKVRKVLGTVIEKWNRNNTNRASFFFIFFGNSKMLLVVANAMLRGCK